ncbi:MAG: hypothetical protein AB7H97_15295 [Pseudobdellovibrionaceae bacterium]
MDQIKCSACGQKFKKRSHARQSYCSALKCQKERRRHWQREKRTADPDYKDNQARAQQAWRERNPTYWIEYRRKNPEYSSRNRELQQQRRQKAKTSQVAKMDLATENSQLQTGTYILIPVSIEGVAKMDACMVEIKFISSLCDPLSAKPSGRKRGRNG